MLRRITCYSIIKRTLEFLACNLLCTVLYCPFLHFLHTVCPCVSGTHGNYLEPHFYIITPFLVGIAKESEISLLLSWKEAQHSISHCLPDYEDRLLVEMTYVRQLIWMTQTYGIFNQSIWDVPGILILKQSDSFINLPVCLVFFMLSHKQKKQQIECQL